MTEKQTLTELMDESFNKPKETNISELLHQGQKCFMLLGFIFLCVKEHFVSLSSGQVFVQNKHLKLVQSRL